MAEACRTRSGETSARARRSRCANGRKNRAAADRSTAAGEVLRGAGISQRTRRRRAAPKTAGRCRPVGPYDPPVDRHFMLRALELAALGKFTAPPNPAVGAVLVHHGRILGEGFHARAGEPHAEAQALEMGACSRSSPDPGVAGSTLFVNLEPCCHVGRTPPCVERILASGVRRVVAAHADPDPRVQGGGFGRLRAGGVEVTTGVLRDAARELNAAYFKYLDTGRPWVTVKAAISVDGVMAPPGVKWITRPRSRRHGRVLRREHDGILTGIATVAADDPRMTPRPRLGVRPRCRIILDPTLRIRLSARILTGLDADPVLIIAAPGASAAARRRIEARGAEVILSRPAAVAPVASPAATDSRARGFGGGRLDLGAVLDHIGRRGIRTLLVEAGPRLTSSFLQEGLADRLVLYLAPRFLGRAEGTGLFDAIRSPVGAERVLPYSQPEEPTARYACLGPDLLADFRMRGRP